MKYEQEDLLEKFIQNEKKSKRWALLSAVAFILVAVTVVYVAKEMKGKPDPVDNSKLENIIKQLNTDKNNYFNNWQNSKTDIRNLQDSLRRCRNSRYNKINP
jgi:hypothetical protein